jgi:hypothetical protein
MSLDNLEVVDAIGTAKDGRTVILNLLDPWDWSDQGRHLLALQAKLNTYFGFVESGQIYKDYPAAVGKALRIDILSRFPLPEIAERFLKEAARVASQLSLTITQCIV